MGCSRVVGMQRTKRFSAPREKTSRCTSPARSIRAFEVWLDVEVEPAADAQEEREVGEDDGGMSPLSPWSPSGLPGTDASAGVPQCRMIDTKLVCSGLACHRGALQRTCCRATRRNKPAVCSPKAAVVAVRLVLAGWAPLYTAPEGRLDGFAAVSVCFRLRPIVGRTRARLVVVRRQGGQPVFRGER